ncbi:thiolase family protein [Chelativorans sp. Marseille-P2723]|uniref:thiolase family protein n=1 Tax=Chelativorans sp. Marseille-P2723 TaxID=2709133 RepID=UPI00156D7C08|nr:thiolase family protein [Chelativorans sp. Marseille-P2723]
MREQIWSKHDVAIVGVGTTRQGAHPGVSPYELALEAIEAALADAGIDDRTRIDGMITARQLDGSGIDPLDVSRLLGIAPRVTGYLDYGTGGFSNQYGAMLIATGVCDIVVCAFARNPPGALEAFSGAATYDADIGLVNAAAASAFGWTQHMARYGTDEATLGRVVVTARKFAAMNPIAAWQESLSLEEYLAQPYVIKPLRSLDIVKVTAGGVALIMARSDIARDLRKKPVYLHAVGRQQTPDIGEQDHFLCRGMRSAAAQVYGAAGMSPADIDVLLVSDASTVAIPLTLENYGFCEEGASANFIASGAIGPGGALPVNPHGGQLSEGYLVGWLHHAEMVRQLRGECGARQVPGAKVAQYTTTGRFREDYLSSIYVAD